MSVMILAELLAAVQGIRKELRTIRLLLEKQERQGGPGDTAPPT